jgi:hypothetical protein
LTVNTNSSGQAANAQPAYAKASAWQAPNPPTPRASAWQALTCLAVAKAKEERPMSNSEAVPSCSSSSFASNFPSSSQNLRLKTFQFSAFQRFNFQSLPSIKTLTPDSIHGSMKR